MKLWVLVKDGVKVIAISEDEESVINYILQNELSLDEYSYFKVKGKEAEKFAINYEDEYLIHDDELDKVFTRSEWLVVSSTIEEERARILTTLSDLEHYIKYYSMGKKEKKVLLKAHSILHPNREVKNLKKSIKLHELINFLRKRTSISELFKETMNTASKVLKIIINTDEE